MFFYRVSYSLDQRVKFEHFDHFHQALDFIKEIRQAGGRANLQKVPRKQWQGVE